MKRLREAPARGALIWLELGPTAGTEQSGRRPALVVSDLAYNRISHRILICPITTTVKGNPFEVVLPELSPVKGAVLVDHLRSVDWHSRFARIAGTAPAEVLEEVRARLEVLLGF